MSTIPTVPYRLEFSVEVPGTPEQVWQALATAKGMSAWFAPTEMEEREGGFLHFTMGPEMGSDGQVTAWEPPRRLVYEEDWAALMGKDPDALSPLTSEFIVEAQSGGTCVVRVTSSGFGTGAAWEQEFWDGMAPGWMPFFDNLRLYLSHFPGQAATLLEASAPHAADADELWSAMRDALGLGDLSVLSPTDSGDVPVRGHGRVGTLPEPMSLRDFASYVDRRFPRTAHGVRVAGDPDRTVRRVAVGAGSGDSLLEDARRSGADAFVTSDLKHHRASEFLEEPGAPALVDLAHWAAEWSWLPVVRAEVDRAVAERGYTVDTRVSTIVTDPWTFRV